MDLNLDFDLSNLSIEDIEPPALPLAVPVRISTIPGSRTVTRTGADTSRFVYLDIETIPDSDRQHLFEDVIERVDPGIPVEQVRKGNVEDLKEFLAEYGDSIPDSYIEDLRNLEANPVEPPKSRSTVLGMLTKLQGKRNKEAEKKPRLHATTPEYCRIVSLSVAVGEGEPLTLVVGLVPVIPGFNRPATEQDLLEFFWRVVGDYGPVVGYNHTNFDIPALMVRSALLGIQPTRMLNLSPYGSECIDLMYKRFPRGKPMQMKTLTKLYNLPNYGDDMDGSKVAETYARDPATVGLYNTNDVLRLRDLFHFLSGHFWM